ncbi:hypothetical protein AAG906_036952 [Vitis piasezkii]
MNDTDCDNDRDDDEFTDEQRVEFLDNLVVGHQRLIKSYMKNNDILQAHKNKIDVLNVENTNFLEKVRFLESKHHSLLEKNIALTQEIKNNNPSSFVDENFHVGTKVLNEILDKCKTHGDKRGLGYINKDETPSNGETVFVKGDKFSCTSLENYDGGVVTFRDGNLAHVKGKGSIVILGCPKLDGVLYVKGLKTNLLSIIQMCDKDHKVNFHQDLCKVVNKEGAHDIGL